MATTVGEVEIALRAKMDALASDFKQAKSIVDKGAREMQNAADAIGKYFKAIGVGLSIEGFRRFIQSSIDAADEMSKLSQKTGVAVQDLAGLQLAFRQSGLEAGSLQGNMARLSQNMEKGVDAFKAMGVETKNADGTLKSTRQMLGEIADKFASYRDGAEKTALAIQLFGRSGAEMIPLLNGGAAALDEFDTIARQLGLTMSEETAKSAEKFNDTMDLVGQSTVGIGRQIVAQLLPTLTGLAGEFLTTVTSGDKLKTAADALAAALKGLYAVALAVVEAFKSVGRTLGAVFAAIGAAITGDFAGAKQILSELKSDLTTGWMETLEQAKRAWETTGNAAVESMAAAASAAKQAAPNVEDMTSKLRDQAKAATELTAAQKEQRENEMARIFAKAESDKGLYEATKAVKEHTAAIKVQIEQADPWAEAMTGAVERIDSAFAEAWRNVGDGFGTLLDGMKEALSQWLAEMAHLLITKPLIANISASLTGGGSMSSLINGGGLLSKIPGIGGAFAPGGLSPFLNQWGVNSGVLKQSFGAGGMGPPATSFSWTGAAANIGAGVAGSYLASSLYGGRESSGIGGTAGGIVGSWWGPVGTFIGSAVGEGIDRALSGSDFSGKRVKLGIGTGPMTAGSDWENVRTLASGLRVGNLRQRAGDAGMSGEQQNAYLAAFDSLDSALTGIARSLGAKVDFSGKALPGMVQPYDGGTSGGAFFGSLAKGELRDLLTKAPDEFVRQWLAAIDDQLSQRVKGIMGDTAGKTAAQLIGLFGFAADIDKLLNIDVLKDAADTAKSATRTVYDLYGEATEQVITLAHTYDGTTDSMSALTDALGIQKTIAAQLAQQYQELSASAAALLGDTKNQILKSTMTPEELYNNARLGFYFTQGAIRNTTDPAALSALTTQGNRQILDAWNAATDEQKKLLQGDFVALLDGMNALVQQQISVGQAALGDREKATANAVDYELFNKAAGVQADAATTQKQSADSMSAAVDRFGAWVTQLPGSITVNLGNLIPSEVNA